ncbi:SAC3 domain-containing protein 1-like isoform X2 [Gigantopelta aegis]|uniref:SAC3 domain-containing protein 1-like isoform X2 n=1 Tax=Gigantopelta aegis TaxID=1735272 RepID=UPI001B88AD58|nr:SAC3 domain-containing protein 1-like isoform X2 [Gigantopelta aegis]
MECEKFIIGTCQTMCPLDEIKMREKEGRLHQLESAHERRTEKYRNRKLQTAEVGKMIKEYSRPAAGCHVPGPESLRPAPVLLKTVQYIFNKLGTANISTFNPVINSQHAQECLKRLLVLYDEVQGTYKCREEFESIYLLYNLGDVNALRHCLDLNRELRKARRIIQNRLL